MNTSPSKIVMMPKFIIPLFFSVLFLTTAHSQIHRKPVLAPSPNSDPKPIILHTKSSTSPNSDPKPIILHIKSSPDLIINLTPSQANPTLPNSNSTPSHAKPTPISKSNTTSSHPKATPPTSHTKPKPSPSSNSTSSHANQTRPNSNSTSSHAKPTPISKPTFPPKSQPILPPKLKPTSPPKSKPTPKPVPSTKNATSSPYQFSNHFCLSRRLDVKKTFCLQVLRSSPTSTKANDNLALLTIVANSAIEFSNKNIALLKELSAKKSTKPDLKTAITDCVSAYEGYLKQFKTLVEESRIEAQLAGYDSELATLEINRCVKALDKTENDEIEVQNKDALDYARLAQNVADAIE